MRLGTAIMFASVPLEEGEEAAANMSQVQSELRRLDTEQGAYFTLIGH
jgi:hypothetical protein